MNSQQIVVWYNGACKVIDTPDMSTLDGYLLQDKTVIWSNPDDGIWWEISCYYIDAGVPTPEEITEKQLVTRMLAVSRAELEDAIIVQVNGQTVLERRREAATECGLTDVFGEKVRQSMVELSDMAAKRGEA